MTEDRLSELLNQAVPELGPALDGQAVLDRARRRRRGARAGAVLLSAVVVGGGSVGIASAVRDHRTAGLATSPTCSSSPYAGTDQEQAVSYPTRGRTVRITVKVDEHFTAHWGFCGEHGTTTTTGDPEVLQASDVAVYSSPRPVPTGQRGFNRPPEDGVYDVRYLAQHPGVVILHGNGSLGSDGDIEVTVTGPALVPVDPGGPAAGACLTDPAAVAVVRLNLDTPQPRCLSVRVGQSLRILNSTNSFGSPGEVITVTLRGFPPKTLKPGQGYTFPKPPSDVLAPGYHRTSGGPHGDAQLLVQG